MYQIYRILAAITQQAVKQVGLYCNMSKIEYITAYSEPFELKSLNNTSNKRVEDFKYLESHIIDSPKDFNIHKVGYA